MKNIVSDLKKRVSAGHEISREEASLLKDVDMRELCSASDELRFLFCGDAFDFCSIINGKSGKCSEDCKYCAQSVHYNTGIKEYPLLDGKVIMDEARDNFTKGIGRFSIVTSGQSLSDKEIESICKIYSQIDNDCGVYLCASHGLLSEKQFTQLRRAGVRRYHNNLETSRRFFPQICSTHSYDEKLEALRMAKHAGLEICSGGIFGLGETFEDRIDMAFELKSLNVLSVPINIFTPIKGTPLGDMALIGYDEILRSVAIYRFILPRAFLRMAGGRGTLEDRGRQIFSSGVNAAISGNMLTTQGITADIDIKMVKEMGYRVVT